MKEKITNLKNKIIDVKDRCKTFFAERNKIFLAAIIGEGVVIIALIAVFVIWKNPFRSAPPVSEEKKAAIKTTVEADIDDKLSGMMNFMINGKYIFTKEDGSEYHYSFDNGKYEGPSEKEEDDFGTYEITSRGGKYIITIYFTDFSEEYEYETGENGSIKLTKGGKTYLLIKSN